MTNDRDIAILGAGMHPWGKWGRNFVEYGVEAAHVALADAGLGWRDMQFVAGADTVRNGYPGLRRRGHVRAGARLVGPAGRVVICRLRIGGNGTRGGARADPCRAVRRCAGRRCRHHSEGFPCADRR